MSFKWKYCWLCQGKGYVEIGHIFKRFLKIKSDKCPFCNGSGKTENLEDEDEIEKRVNRRRRGL